MTDPTYSLDDIERACAAATEGPWEAREEHGGRETGHGWLLVGSPGFVGKTWGWGPSQENAAFISLARTALPELAAKVRELEAENDRLANIAFLHGGCETIRRKDVEYLLSRAEAAEATIRLVKAVVGAVDCGRLGLPCTDTLEEERWCHPCRINAAFDAI